MNAWVLIALVFICLGAFCVATVAVIEHVASVLARI